jgi:uncharacterized protein involved in outer membrane biogenesis
VNVSAKRATAAGAVIDNLSAQAVMKGDDVAIAPLTFGLFGGKYEGSLNLTLGDAAPAFHWRASLSNLDVAAAAAFAGSPDTISGRFSGDVDLAGRGSDTAAAMKSAAGSARISVVDGVVKNLGLVRTVVAAASLDPATVRSSAAGSRDEPFSRLGGSFQVAGGTASTTDLRFESPDLLLTAAGQLRLDGSLLDFSGQLQLSEELSRQVGTGALARAAQDRGRLTLPAIVSGSADNPQVRVDLANLAKRALRNSAQEQGKKLIDQGLGGLLRK